MRFKSCKALATMCHVQASEQEKSGACLCMSLTKRAMRFGRAKLPVMTAFTHRRAYTRALCVSRGTRKGNTRRAH